MSTAYALLGLLNLGSNYGYELKKLHDRLFGQGKPLAYGQVYATLARLRRDGLASQLAEEEPSGGPERVRYAITPAGVEALQQWLLAPEPPAANLQAALYLKTVVALIIKGEAAPYLDRQRHAHIERMRELTRQRRQSETAEALLIDYAIYHLEADLRWIELTSARLAKLKEELCL